MIAMAEQKAIASGSTTATEGRYPLQPEQIALSYYHRRLAFDERLRNDRRGPRLGVDEQLVADTQFEARAFS